jgi:hypothetical protein
VGNHVEVDLLGEFLFLDRVAVSSAASGCACLDRTCAGGRFRTTDEGLPKTTSNKKGEQENGVSVSETGGRAAEEGERAARPRDPYDRATKEEPDDKIEAQHELLVQNTGLP